MKCFILLIISSILLFSGCDSNMAVEVEAVIWIAVGGSQDSFLFEMNNDGTIKVINGNVILDTDTREIFYGENIETKIKRPSTNELSAIKTLLCKIGDGEEGIINSGNDTIEIFAIIQNKLYWTPFYEVKNEKLMELTRLLLDLTDLAL